MDMDDALPKTLTEAVQYFADADHCLAYLVARRWPNGVTCPTCGLDRPYFDAKRRTWECRTRHPRRKFSVKVGTIFEDSPLGLDKWLPTVWMIANEKNGVSSWEIHRAIGVTQKTAWFMLHRIRLAMQDEDTGGKIGGSGTDVEVDETYIGGKARNMHASKRKRIGISPNTSMVGKVAVMGLPERNTGAGSKIRLEVVAGRKRHHLRPSIDKHILHSLAGLAFVAVGGRRSNGLPLRPAPVRILRSPLFVARQSFVQRRARNREQPICQRFERAKLFQPFRH